MKKTYLTLALLAGLSCAAANAANAANAADIAVSATAGTTGLGLHASFPIQPKLNARVGFNYLNYDSTGNTTDADYNYKLKLRTFDVLADYFPMDNGFRMTGGLVYNGNKVDVDMKAKSGAQYVVNGTPYPAAQAGSINGTVDFKKIAPYLGIGWGNAVVNKGWGFSADLGVMFQGNPQTNLTSSGCQATIDCAQLARNLAVEKNKLNDDVNSYKTYPVIRVGASYRF
jgi:opacity protein-like surface antigen